MYRRFLLFSVAAAIGFAAPARAELLPTVSGRVQSIDIGGKRSVYYRIDRGQEEVVRVDGPARIKCIVRVAPDTTSATTAYAIAVFDAGRRIKFVKTETVPADLYWRETGEPVAKSRSFFVDVGKGSHELRFRLVSDQTASAGLRCLNKGTRAAGGQVAVFPVAMAEAITLVVKEKPIEYAVARREAPVELTIVGPTRLRVVSRYIYDDRMKGTQRYTVRVERDGKPSPGKVLKTEKSLLAECREKPAWNFGRSRTFYVEIPRGVHRVSLRPSNNDSPGLALRFTIPREDIAHEKR